MICPSESHLPVPLKGGFGDGAGMMSHPRDLNSPLHIAQGLQNLRFLASVFFLWLCMPLTVLECLKNQRAQRVSEARPLPELVAPC